MPLPAAHRDDPHPGDRCRCGFADGYATTARVFTFDGLVDGREHLALGLGDRAAAGHRRPATDRRRWSGCTASA